MSTERPKSTRPWRRWTLRCLLLLFVPVCAALAVYGHAYRQKQLAIESMHLNGSKVSAEAVQRFRRAVPDCDLQL